MLKTAVDTTGTKLDGFLAAGFVGAGVMTPDAFLQAYGTQIMFWGGLLLLAIRIAIAIKQFLKE